MSGQVGAALALGLALVLSPGFADAQSHLEGELNRAKAALQLKKYDEAAARFEKVARTGNPTAQFYIGRLTAMGLGVAKDLPKAVNWFDLSAKQGYVEAQAVLGFHYMEGVGVAQSYAEAARVPGYHYGFGVKEDRAKAHALYRQSSALGNLKARGALATFDRFSWPDQRSQDIYNGRVASYMSAINGCQLRANAEGRAVTCLVPGVDWNPKTWESC